MKMEENSIVMCTWSRAERNEPKCIHGNSAYEYAKGSLHRSARRCWECNPAH